MSRTGVWCAWAAMAAATMAGLPAWAAGPVAVDRDAEPTAPHVPQSAQGDGSVKDYLLAVVASARSGAADLRDDAGSYAALVARHGNDAAAAARAEPELTAKLVRRMRNEYKRIDSFGYEYVEGIVAGVPSLTKYDVLLDSGVKAEGAGVQDQVADIVIVAPDATVDHQGSLNNFLIEPTVYGTNPKFVAATDVALPGFAAAVNLPKPGLIVKLADFAVEHYAELDRDARAWQPDDRTLFQAMANMTPTLAGYFDDWKESKKYGGSGGGRFVAVSRVSDMRGIMASTRLNWVSMEPKVTAKDAALSAEITKGYDRIMHFIDTVDARAAKSPPISVQTIDALGTQAKEKADKLTVQVGQAAAELGFDVNGK